MSLATWTDLTADNGVQGFDGLFNDLLALLQALNVVDYNEVEIDVSISPTAVGIFPAKVDRLGVSWHVTQVIVGSGGIGSFKMGDNIATADRYGTGAALGLDTHGEDAATADPTGWFGAAGDVKLTPNVGAFTTGKVKVRAYFKRTPPVVAP